MNILNSWPLKSSLRLVEVDAFDPTTHSEQARTHLMSEYPMLPKGYGASDETKTKLKTLGTRLASKYELRLAILDGDKTIGWTHGWQDSVETDCFFMGTSLVLPEYRKQGMYQELTRKVFELTKEAGFQSVWSLHVMTNNPVIIAKLKMDFHIYGFELNTRYGALIRMIYHHNETKQKAMRFRAGAYGDTGIQNILLK